MGGSVGGNHLTAGIVAGDQMTIAAQSSDQYRDRVRAHASCQGTATHSDPSVDFVSARAGEWDVPEICESQNVVESTGRGGQSLFVERRRRTTASCWTIASEEDVRPSHRSVSIRILVQVNGRKMQTEKHFRSEKIGLAIFLMLLESNDPHYVLSRRTRLRLVVELGTVSDLAGRQDVHSDPY